MASQSAYTDPMRRMKADSSLRPTSPASETPIMLLFVALKEPRIQAVRIHVPAPLRSRDLARI